MSDSMKDAWDEVGENFSTLAKLVRDRYRESQPDDGTAVRPAADPAQDEAAAKFRHAFDSLIDAARDLSDRASEITHSEEIRSQARQAGTSLNSALSKTVDALVDDLGDLFKTVKVEIDGVLRRERASTKQQPTETTATISETATSPEEP